MNLDDLPKIQICCSTLNQIVNYIPAIQFNTEKLYCFTIAKSKDNEEWDKNLEIVINSTTEMKTIMKTIEFNKENLCDIKILTEEIERKLNELKSNNNEAKSLLWNVTGGQRYFLMAIYDIFKKREGDYLCYLEGNTDNIIMLMNEGNNEIRQVKNTSSHPHFKAAIDITIDNALKLMGFREKTTQEEDKIEFSENNAFGEADEFLKLADEFQKKIEIRKLCFEANKNGSINKDNFNELFSFLENSVKDKIEKELLSDKTGSFGKVFEWMCAAIIYKTIAEEKLPVNEMIVSQKITFDNNNQTIDEFDIILVTKGGKLIVFECKTGHMSGDNAKSNKYSTYAVGGVYGMLVLLVPLLNTEIENIPANLKQAISSAKRANLEVWRIDEIQDKLKKEIQKQEG